MKKSVNCFREITMEDGVISVPPKMERFKYRICKIMRTINLKVFNPIILIALLITACSKEECCVSTDITSSTMSIVQLGNCEDAIFNMQFSFNEQYLIITNQSDYDDKVLGSCHPDLDFTQNNLVIGKVYSQKKILALNYKFYRSCEPNYYKLSIIPEHEGTGISDELIDYYYHFVIPKSEKIDFLKIVISDRNNLREVYP